MLAVVPMYPLPFGCCCCLSLQLRPRHRFIQVSPQTDRGQATVWERVWEGEVRVCGVPAEEEKGQERQSNVSNDGATRVREAIARCGAGSTTESARAKLAQSA